MLKLFTETLDRLRYNLPQRPKQVQIEVTNRCNMDCHMCPREDLSIELEHMDWDKFIQVVDQLTHQEDITLTGWGEPFLHPRIFNMIDYCKKRKHIVNITSNGLFDNSEMVDRILKSGLNTLTFSVDSIDGDVEDGHTNSGVFKNIEAIGKGCTNTGLSLRLQSTLHEGCEKDLLDVIRYAAKIGARIVNVGRLDRKYAPDLKRPDEREEERVFNSANKLAGSLGVQLDWLQYAVSTGTTRLVYKLLRKKLHRSGKFCLKTFNYAYVSREGNVTPCCLLPDVKMGSMLEGDLETIWQSDKFNHFRENFRDTCGSCDLWTIDQVDTN